ncbi:GDSL esterase/lipase 1-like [Rosa rugosa]|uniref:GDSL esterase/lipase 1-like n=1 Tax=Rosa rugosa TaxID=74645 RepID=UPI002B40C71B|nr:GDSL esterase/lipase 1-like [Rosa rugosa]
MANLRFCYISELSFYASIVIPSNCLAHFSLQKEPTPLFVFGDSPFDAGKNNYFNTTKTAQANYWPYGETYFGYPTGRYTDGRQILDFILDKFAIDSIIFTTPFNYYVYGVNSTPGGAGALNETHQGLVIDLQTQLSYCKNVEKQLRHKLGHAQAKTLLSSAVYLFSIGSNDYFTLLQFNISKEFSYSEEEFIGMVLAT